jgi:dihydroxy-acid dehydratase
MGYAREDFVAKPVIAILNTWSDMTTCHTHLRDRAEQVKRGVWQAGGFPLEVPVLSLSETFMKPTAMMYRNLLAIETEEVLRSQPVDAAVLLGGCDKTTPGLLLGAISVDLPTIYLPAGPMLKGNHRGQTLGSGSDVWKVWDDYRAGTACGEDLLGVENGVARSAGHCMTMGTASTMTAIAEALGLTLPGASSIPAPLAEHERMATRCGRRIVEMAWEDLKLSDLLTSESFDNAIVADMALGGSTNAIVHLIALARRAGIPLQLKRFDELSRTTPTLANIRPSGEYLMPDFYEAGGLPALLVRLGDRLNLDCRTVSGATLGEDIAGAEVYDDRVILPLDQPLSAAGGTAVLHGNLAPEGCVIKPTAADPKLLKHAGRAVVFSDYNDLTSRIDDPQLDVTADSVIVLQQAGPLGAGFPEWGMLPIPKKLLAQGVRDMVRISDARMSGTSYGTCVLHLSPESHVGGMLALVRDGDLIELDVPARTIHLAVDDAELAARRAAWTPPEPLYTRGYGKLYCEQVTQAEDGCDFRFLHSDGRPTPDPEIH